jgi:hypothetical protein
MQKWDEFGEQVNRLVYALAGCKFQADIERANRYVAEQIFYSEVSVRMMRQGRFLPHEETALETLVEIGKSDAELGREWASHLLHSGHHSNPERILQKIFHLDINILQPVPVQADSHFTIFPRLVGGVGGSFSAVLFWTYLINPTYPAPHELGFFKECTWGLLLGLGLACGILGADLWSCKRKWSQISKSCVSYLVLPVSGVLGALLWNGILARVFDRVAINSIASTGLETFSFGATYGFAFVLGLNLMNWDHLDSQGWRSRLKLALLFVLICGGLSLAGYALAVVKPAFDNQKEIDLFVGILLRIGLILLVCILFPRANYSEQSE